MRASIVPTWAALAALLPSTHNLLQASSRREKNGWCIYSAQLWLALNTRALHNKKSIGK